jgi:hypothetical protein
VKLAVPVPVPVGVEVLVGLGVGGGVPLLEREVLPVLDDEAPLVREAVGEALTVELAESVGEGVREPVPLPLLVSVPEGVAVGVMEAAVLLERGTLGVLLAGAPAVRDAVGDADWVELPESVVEGVAWGVARGVAEGESVEVVEEPVGGGVRATAADEAVALLLGLQVPLADKAAVPEGLRVGDVEVEGVGEEDTVGGGCEGVALEEAPGEDEVVGVRVPEDVGMGVTAEEAVLLPVPEAEREPLAEGVGVSVGEREGVRELLPVLLPLRDTDPLLLALAPAVRVVLGVVVRVLLAVPVPLPLPLPLPLRVGVALGVGVTLTVSVALGEGVALGRAL